MKLFGINTVIVSIVHFDKFHLLVSPVKLDKKCVELSEEVYVINPNAVVFHSPPKLLSQEIRSVFDQFVETLKL